MMSKPRLLILSILLVAAVVSVVNLLSMRADISAKDMEIRNINEKIIEQKLYNEEYEDILADANIADFYRSIAESSLGYASRDEKIYINITGQ